MNTDHNWQLIAAVATVLFKPTRQATKALCGRGTNECDAVGFGLGACLNIHTFNVYTH